MAPHICCLEEQQMTWNSIQSPLLTVNTRVLLKNNHTEWHLISMVVHEMYDDLC